MHILPQLRKLEKKFNDSLFVIGVHSAKFDTERATENVRAAVSRYNVNHPVVNDVELRVMSAFAVRAWPTLMFIDPEGKVIGKHEGEFQIEAMDRVLSSMVEEFDRSEVLNREPVAFDYGSEAAKHRTLSFPGKILAPEDGNLYIADSNHHRVIVATDDGKVTDIIGNGESPLAVESFETPPGILNPLGSKWSYEEPLFDNPQGMVLVGDALYVADAGAHTIQRADLEARSVSVVAGTGEQALIRHTGGDATSFPLNSPYDLEFADGILYIAMAGAHQLWQLDISAGTVEPFAGTGAENIVDGLRMEALLAQPYGLALDSNNLFFADSETSAIRVAKIGEGGRVVTLTGTGLFDFGDHDGIGKKAVLQHPQDVASAPGAVYIADTYNHKIKRMDLSTLRITTLAGSGAQGLEDGDALSASFDEPAGIAYRDGVVYVADTNNHRIRKFDVERGVVTTLELTGI